MKPSRIAFIATAVGLLSLADLVASGELAAGRLGVRFAFVIATSAAVWLSRRSTKGLAGCVSMAGLFAALYLLTRATSAAWLAVATFWGLLPESERVLNRGARHLPRLATRAGLAGVGTLAPLLADQVESRFADEEFFVALTGLLLWAALFVLLTAWWSGDAPEPAPGSWRRRMMTLFGVVAAVVALAVVGVRGYRASFYPPTAPSFPGITVEDPFLCGQVAPGLAENDGQVIWERLVERVEAEPAKTPQDLAFLALARQDESWAQAFRTALLAEARAGAYTGPAGTIKSVQFEAAGRVYYAARMRQAFPSLFSPSEEAEIEAWMARIDQRALRPEWVDWLYALAFGTPVQGPYANQEIGVGLLSALDGSRLVPEALQTQNQSFLDREAAGWAERFRNTDDAYLYQTVWLINAYLQSLARTGPQVEVGEMERNKELSFEWLLLQALPDGTSPSYNHPVQPELGNVAYLGAVLLDDPRYLWLADRALSVLEVENRPLPAVPGMETPLSMTEASPTAGSCLLYGDSGTPTEPGPLAPDKIVFRDGWADDSTWLLLNLRFTGWHRYKATNSLAGLYQSGLVVVDQGRSQPYSWLPAGRSLPRDKRVGREDLNGLLVPRSGLGQVLYALTGQGSPWAQDPPPYAGVERVEMLGGLDLSRTTVGNWRGWDQARTIYFFHGGPVFIVDEAEAGYGGGRAALTWHLAGQAERVDGGLLFVGAQGAARMVWPDGAQPWLDLRPATLPDGTPGWDVVYYAPETRRLDFVTAYLGPDWTDAAVNLDPVPGDHGVGWLLSVEGSRGYQEALHNSTHGRLEAGGLATDGLAVTLRDSADGHTQVCYVGGSEVSLALAHRPVAVVGGDVDWVWHEGELVLHVHQTGTSGCVDLQASD